MEDSVNQRTQGVIDKYVSREWQLVIKTAGILGLFYTMVLVPLNSMKMEIEYIKTNHLKHIEDDIAEIRKIQTDMGIENKDQDTKLERIITMLEEHEKATEKLTPIR